MFRNRQGGVYTIGSEKKPQLKGANINACSEARAYMDAKIKVTSLHGKATMIRLLLLEKKMEPRY